VGEDLVELVRVPRAALVDFDPEDFSGEECAVLVEELATTEKICAAARLRAAARAGQCGAHKERGFADVSDWMARASGSTASSAKSALDTAAALESQPDVKAALEGGELSLAQARELVRTEAECPGSTADLLDVAKTESLRSLREQARDRRVRAIDPEELHRMQHAAMGARHGRTRLGNVTITMEFPPEFGVPITNRLDAETDRLWQQWRRQIKRKGSVEHDQMFAGDLFEDDGSTLTATRRRAALAAHAFLRMLETGGKGKAHQADLVIVCDLQAYRRGHAAEGEPCHIIGGGPIPVSLARQLGQDAFLKAVLHDGTAIHTIAHFGRRYPAVLRTALMLGGPPAFEGRICSEPGCDRRHHLERDHIDPCANGGKTTYENLASPCWPHHRFKTERDRKAGLLRGQPRGPD
jgi:HNH endonuclease